MKGILSGTWWAGLSRVGVWRSHLFVGGDQDAGTRHSQPNHRRRAHRAGRFKADVIAQGHRGKGHVQGDVHAWADEALGWGDAQTSS